MPSSTSNSNPAVRAPALKWGFVWLGACLLAIAMILSFEVFWRANGHRPSVAFDPLLWSYHRYQVSDHRSQVVLLGSSRIQGGFSTEVFHDRFPSIPLAVLPISGNHPLAVLRDLAEDESFRGTVICSATAQSFSSSSWDEQQEYVDYFHNASPVEYLEPVPKWWLQSQLVVLHPNVRLSKLVKTKLRDGRLPGPLYSVMKFDRSRLENYSMVDLEVHRQRRLEYVRKTINHPSSFELWSKGATAVGSFVRKIKERGGDVVFVRFPTSDEHWEITEQMSPKQVYWDQLGRLVGAKTIHFRDVPSLAHFNCPDTSHLDFRDSPKFTSALIDELVKQRILQDDQSHLIPTTIKDKNTANFSKNLSTRNRFSVGLCD